MDKVESAVNQALAPAVPLYDYQIKWMLDDSRFKIGMFSRQTGKTFTTTLEIADDMWVHEAQKRRTPWVILSRGERQAREAMDSLKVHLKAYNYAVEIIEGSYETTNDDGEKVSYKQLEVQLSNGSWCKALPANPDTARGFSANVFLDEFAIHKDSREIWGALFPIISAGWKIRVTSTPKGKGNKFYELMTAAPKPGKKQIWSRHIVDIYQAVDEGLTRDIDELRDGLNDPDLWAQEYELMWLDEASSWLSYDLINSVEHCDAGKPDLFDVPGEYYIGNDIAARNDLWVAWVLKRVGDVLWTVDIRVLRRASFAAQDQELDELYHQYKPRRIGMDQTGMGEKPVEDAKRRYGEYTVEGVLFNATNKQDMATLAKQKFEDRQLRIPEGDQAIRKDLHSLKKTVSMGGNVRFDADRDGDGHADRAWALFLAIDAATDNSAPASAAPPEDITPEDLRSIYASQREPRGRQRIRIRG